MEAALNAVHHRASSESEQISHFYQRPTIRSGGKVALLLLVISIPLDIEIENLPENTNIKQRTVENVITGKNVDEHQV